MPNRLFLLDKLSMARLLLNTTCPLTRVIECVTSRNRCEYQRASVRFELTKQNKKQNKKKMLGLRKLEIYRPERANKKDKQCGTVRSQAA